VKYCYFFPPRNGLRANIHLRMRYNLETTIMLFLFIATVSLLYLGVRLLRVPSSHTFISVFIGHFRSLHLLQPLIYFQIPFVSMYS